MDFLAWLLLAALAAACTLGQRLLLHDFQLESYQLFGYAQTLRRTWRRAVIPGVALSGAVLLSMLDALFMPLWLSAAVFALLCVGVGLWLGLWHRRLPAKKPFRVTPRVRRLVAMQACTHLLLLWLLAGLMGGFDLTGARLLGGQAPLIIALTAYPLFLPAWLALAALLAWPMERLIRYFYARDTRRVLRGHPGLLVIGITGSYGKTSVKHILYTLLSERYQVLASPGSINTPMGLAGLIRGSLTPAHQILIAEMGARHRGDIRELNRLLHPRYGVLTAVGPQHLETFGSLEAVRETKYDLIRSLPKDGCAFFCGDDPIVRALYERTEGEKRLSCVHACEAADVWADELEVGPQGSSFRLYTRSGSVRCQTQLLGEHSIRNILTAAAVAVELGLTLEEISRGISRLRPVAHRLQLLPASGGVTVIDDAFNSNPAGTKAALDVLSRFPGRHIVITPGMVELGESESRLNRTFGQQLAAAADTVILVGPRHTTPIREGLADKGFPTGEIHVTHTLQEAQTLLRQLARSGDTVLLENDLPDNYNE